MIRYELTATFYTFKVLKKAVAGAASAHVFDQSTYTFVWTNDRTLTSLKALLVLGEYLL